MPSSTELQERVRDAITKKLGEANCPLCKNFNWTIQLGTSSLPIKTESAYGASYTQNALPSAILICNICGNTHLLNLKILLDETEAK